MIKLARARAERMLVCLAAALLAGCGGGGGGSLGTVTGLVTDVNGAAVTGATVWIGGSRSTSLSNGTFSLTGVGEGYETANATITINGHRWSGESVVDVIGGEQNRTVSIVVSDERNQGGIEGTVIDPSGYPLEDAKIFVGGPYSSTLAVTDHSGYYRVDKLEGGTQYTITCSLAGYTNDTKSVTITPGQLSPLSFALSVNASQGAIPAPTGVNAMSWTLATDVTRAEPATRSVYDWLKRLYRHKKGLPEPVLSRQIERKGATRVTPAGSLIEVDLFWNYTSFNDLFGYLIRRGTSQSSLADVALLRDPLATAFFDVDPALTPDVVYYYTVSRLDTVDFPSHGTAGQPSAVVSAQPLPTIRAISPVSGASVSTAPILEWTAVPGAVSYQIYVWDRFPDLQDSADPNGVTPYWPADLQNPGSSMVNGGSVTSQLYQGPALQSGHTYYWMVVATDQAGNNLSASQIAKFAVR